MGDALARDFHYGKTTAFHSFVRMGRVPMMNLETSASGRSK